MVSARVGAGHDAAADGLAAAAAEAWPGVVVRRVDALDLMAPGMGPGSRAFYTGSLRYYPLVYDWWFRSLWRVPRWAELVKRVSGMWCGRPLGRELDRFDPDLVLSTYPIGTAGLDWLRRRGRYPTVPFAAVVPDFGVHPFWVFGGVENHLVMDDACVPGATALAPGSRVLVAAPPVGPEFHDGDPAAARAELGLDPAAFVVVLSTGSYGLGDIAGTVRVLLDAEPRVQVVAVCGRNEGARRRLLTLPEAGGRLQPLGWVDRMPVLLRAADAVVNNAGGATANEALATGRPVLLYEMLPAHGRANAALMERAGVAVVCPTATDLHREVRRLCREEGTYAALRGRAAGHAGSGRLAADLRRLVERPAPLPSGRQPLPRRLRAPTVPHPPPATPMPPEDAFFLHTETAAVPQQVVGVAVVDPSTSPDGRFDRETVAAAFAGRLHRMPALRRRLATPLGPLTRPVWRPEPSVDLGWHVVAAPPVDGDAGLPAAVSRILASPLDRSRPLWRVHVIGGLDRGRAAMVVQLHHALVDGIVTVTVLREVLDDTARPAPGEPLPPLPAAGGAAVLAAALRGELADPVRRVAARLGRWRADPAGASQGVTGWVRGVLALARSGVAPPSALDHPLGPQRRFAAASLELAAVRRAARRLAARPDEVVLAAVCAGLAELAADRPALAPTGRLRAVLPQSMRRPSSWAQPGNRTGALRVDLPVGPMPPVRRLRAVQAALAASRRSGQADAAALLMRGVGLLLPTPVHRLAARAAYRARWFNLIVSYLPGPRRPLYLAGARLEVVYPALSLAEGVGLSVGALQWTDRVGIGISAEPGALPDPDRLAAAVTAGFAALATAEPDPDGTA